MNIRRLNPLATASGRTVYTVLRRVLLVFSVPKNLELVIEETVDMLESDVVLSATSGRHMLRIRHRHGEDASKTCVAHSVTAG